MILSLHSPTWLYNNQNFILFPFINTYFFIINNSCSTNKMNNLISPTYSVYYSINLSPYIKSEYPQTVY